jgi:hypothetical protein
MDAAVSQRGRLSLGSFCGPTWKVVPGSPGVGLRQLSPSRRLPALPIQPSATALSTAVLGRLSVSSACTSSCASASLPAMSSVKRRLNTSAIQPGGSGGNEPPPVQGAGGDLRDRRPLTSRNLILGPRWLNLASCLGGSNVLLSESRCRYAVQGSRHAHPARLR